MVRGVGRLLAVGGDHVHDGLRFREIQFAVQEGTLRELAGTGGFGTCGKDKAEDFLHEVHAAVALQFHDVFAGVRCRSAEHEANGLVDRLAVCFDDRAEERRVPGHVSECPVGVVPAKPRERALRRYKHLRSNAQCIAPGNANDANAARRIRRSNGCNRTLCHENSSFCDKNSKVL